MQTSRAFMSQYNGLLLSGPSGAGKSTLLRLARSYGLRVPVSHTTRSMRPGEVNGRDYHFVTDKVFHDMKETGSFIETSEGFDYAYGTSVQEVDSHRGVYVLDLDLNGVKAMKQSIEGLYYVCVMPPSLEVLKQRLQGRGTNGRQLELRLSSYKVFQNSLELFDYVIINDDLNQTEHTFLAMLHTHFTSQT